MGDISLSCFVLYHCMYLLAIIIIIIFWSQPFYILEVLKKRAIYGKMDLFKDKCFNLNGLKIKQNLFGLFATSLRMGWQRLNSLSRCNLLDSRLHEQSFYNFYCLSCYIHTKISIQIYRSWGPFIWFRLRPRYIQKETIPHRNVTKLSPFPSSKTGLDKSSRSVSL